VLGSSGALTGYHWGVERKRAMLAVEAAKHDHAQPEKCEAVFR
jgi:AraC family transcriptional regulator of adaptative response/methylated-DNA-[protein]-cysteine methyltransferase